MLKTLQVGPKLCFSGDGDSCLESRIRSLFIGRIMSPNWSPSFQSVLRLATQLYHFCVCKNHQWPCTASGLSLNSLVWYSKLLLSCFTLSFYPPSQHSPLGTLGSCHLEASIVLTLLWISLFLLTSSLVPILCWAGSYSAFKDLADIISYGKPSLILPQQHLLLLWIYIRLCTHLNCMWFC